MWFETSSFSCRWVAVNSMPSPGDNSSERAGRGRPPPSPSLVSRNGPSHWLLCTLGSPRTSGRGTVC